MLPGEEPALREQGEGAAGLRQRLRRVGHGRAGGGAGRGALYRSPDLGALPLSEAARSFVSSALTKVPASWAGIQRFCITLCVDRSRQLHSVRQQVPTYL